MIRPAIPEDAEAIARIYNHYILHTAVTFEERPVSSPEMAGRISAVQAALFPWLVCERDGQVVGYAYANSWQGPPAGRAA